MKAETREILSETGNLEAVEIITASGEVLSDEDMKYLWRVLNGFWIRKGFRRIADDLAQVGVTKAWRQQGKHKGKNDAALRTFSFRVGVNEGWNVVRKELRQQTIFEENKDTIAQNLGEKSMSDEDSDPDKDSDL